tara:strand:+ start:979 stop:1278 length:300 start_codon:yes stop_codon:yes gene_type:complete
MSVIKGICSAIKEDKVNEWLKDNNRKIDISGDKWNKEELDMFERERQMAVQKVIDSCEYADVSSSLFNTAVGNLIKTGGSSILVSGNGKVSNVDAHENI